MTGSVRVHTLIDSLTWGGAEMLLADLAVGAPSAGIDLSVGYLRDLDSSPSARRLRETGVEPALLGTGRMIDSGSLRRVRSHLQEVQADIVHTHLATADFLGTIAARSLGIPSVSTIHLIGPGASDPPGMRTTVKSGLTAFVRSRVGARTIAVSEAARLAYLKRHRLRSTGVVTIHNGIAAKPPSTPREQMRAQLGLEPDTLAVAIVSVLRRGKGHELAFEAVARMRAQWPALKLIVIGDGPDRDRLAALAAPLGASALLLGHRDDVPDLLNAVDVLLHPTLMDAFPTVLLEACAAGLPILASEVGGIPEIVGDGQNGLLLPAVPTTEAIVEGLSRMLQDPALRARLGANARIRYEQEFSAQRWAGRLRALYDEVLSTEPHAEQTPPGAGR
jgi:glycosyltransferase involved in cell wall biosynthesis